ncbi:MAG: Gfo/Idh/MocA family oxidoreductase [Eubacteriales bacterium]|nr:Gfo/Idh/MocA family oxidoreductase [Eubacteriales bacterium]
MKKLNAAVVGCGTIFSAHAEAIRNSELANLAAVADIREDRARRAANEFSCDWYTDYRKIVEDDNIDVVHICTPHHLHCPMAVDAMRSGKHVLVEKPMAVNTESALEMLRVEAETGMKLGVCFQNRYNHTTSVLRELVSSGKVGAILGARAVLTWNRDERYYIDSGWRGTYEKEGGGVLINQAIHTIDLLILLLGDYDWVKGHVDTRLLRNFIEVEDTADATVKFKTGARALVFATNCYPMNSTVIVEIVFEKAVARLEEELTVRYNTGETEVFSNIDKRRGEKSYWGCGHTALVRDFYESILGNRPFDIDGRSAIKALQVVDAIRKSSLTDDFVYNT